jgi:hypothetical protein
MCEPPDLRRVFCRTSSIRLPCFYYFFLAVVVIRYPRWRFADPAIAAAFAREFGTTQTPSLRIKDA